jgi:glycosyltransferase involved in cell wall biosynthesis
MTDNKFIMVVPVYNAEKFIEKCLKSIFCQDYENYDVIVIDDCSPDKTYVELQRLHEEFSFNLIRNNIRLRSPLENFIKGIETCSKDKEDIIVTVDGDDFLADCNVLSYLNSIYQDESVWMTYGQYEPLSGAYKHLCQPIPDTRTYRKSGLWITSALRTVKRKLFDKIDRDDLKTSDGNYYKASGDSAYIYPLIEMSGKNHIKFIDKVLYMYNDIYPGNEMKTDTKKQLETAQAIRDKDVYDELIGEL